MFIWTQVYDDDGDDDDDERKREQTESPPSCISPTHSYKAPGDSHTRPLSSFVTLCNRIRRSLFPNMADNAWELLKF